MVSRATLLGSGSFLAVTALALSACGGGGGGSSGGGGYMPPGGGGGPSPTPAPNAQVVRVAIPTSAIGTIDTPYGPIGGYTQMSTSQILGFVPGQQIEIENAQDPSTGIPHTLGDTGGSGSFPASANLSLNSNTRDGGTFKHGFQAGSMQPGQLRGPFTLAKGIYFIGCAYHYSQYGMRDVLVVAPNATPGPQASPPPGQTSPPSGSGGGYGP